MRRAGMLALTISLLLLCACGGGGKTEDIRRWRGELAGAESIRFTAALTADMGESAFFCVLDCAYRDGETAMTIVEPALAAGVTARIRDGETTLRYDGLELNVGTLPGGLAPAEAVPFLLDAMRCGFVNGWQKEELDGVPLLRLELYTDEESNALLWLREADMTPLRAELVRGGRMIAGMTITDFTIEELKDNGTGENANLG